MRHGIDTIEALIAHSLQGLSTEVVGLGEGSLETIRKALATRGLSLAEDATKRQFPGSKLHARHARNHSQWLQPIKPEPADGRSSEDNLQ